MRADELGQSPSDVRRKILHAFERRMPKRERRQFEVRLFKPAFGATELMPQV